MQMLRRLMPLLVCTVVWLLAPAAAHAGDPYGFHLVSSSLFVHENEGAAIITVQRTDTSTDGQVGYVAVGPGHPCGSSECTAQYNWDFTFVQGRLDFPRGVSTESFAIPIVDHHAYTINQTLQVSIYGSYPQGLASPSSAVLTIVNDDPPSPLGSVASLGSNPLAGDSFFLDNHNDPTNAATHYRRLRAISDEPWVARFGKFSGHDVGMAVAHYLARASVQDPASVPELSTYRLVHGDCRRGYGDTPAEAASYHDFIQRFAEGIGDYRAVLFLEMDSIITAGCLNQAGLATRMNELNDAIDILSSHCPRLVIYLDAGAADALRARSAARLLLLAGVSKIQGFFLNSTHFDWTRREIRYGEKVSRMTGGKHFVVSTSENGRGPLRPPNVRRDGNEVLCNPPGRGLGPKPTSDTGFPNVDAFAWILHPGESTGRCGAGAPKTGMFWPKYARMLIRNANFRVR